MATKKKAKPPATRRARTPRKPSDTVQLDSVAPSFTVNDVEKSLAWYRDVLGFTVKQRWETDGQLAGVEVAAGKAIFMLAQDDWKKGRNRAKGKGFRLYCATSQNVDRLAERIKARGGTLTQEPRDQPWGQRDFAVEDPDGFKITIGSAPKR